jgi:hypothetical protein
VEHMLRTSGEPSQCSEEARRRVSFDTPPPPKYPALPFLILGISRLLFETVSGALLQGDTIIDYWDRAPRPSRKCTTPMR